MASPPPSIASFIAGQGDPSLGAGSDEDQAALLTYLKATYPDSSSHNDVTALPTGRYRSTPTPGPSDLPGQPPNDYTPYPSQHSPINPSIPIPSSLAALAAQSTATINIPNLSAEFDHNQIRSGTDDRGEMGGKRRKLPHERAGWKEMDREPKTKKKRGARRQGSELEGNGGGNGNGGMDNMAYLTGHEPSQKMEQQGQMDSSSFEDQAGDGDQTGIHAGNQDHTDPNDPKSAPNKKARAEQNKRAQQVFRRKREEHIKKLEEEAAAATDLRHSLSLAESKLRELALSLEAEHIEKLALRLSLRNLSQLGTNVLDSDSTLITQIGERTRQGVEETTGELDQAFRTLEAQSRELAKVNRNKKAS